MATLVDSVRWRVYLYGLPAMAWAAFLMATALSPSLGPIEDIDIVSHQDKIVHFVQYLVLAPLTYLALVRGTRWDGGRIGRVTFLSVAVYGALLEGLQVLVPSRDLSSLDLLANLLGGLVGTWLASTLLSPAAVEKALQE